MVNWVTIEKFADDTGMTPAAVGKRVGCGGVWPELLVWVKLNGRIYISRSGWDTWLETAAASGKRQKTASKLNLPTTANDAENALNLSPPPLT